MANIWVIGGTNRVTLTGHHNVQTKEYPIDSDVEMVSLTDPEGAPVGSVANLAMPYVDGTGKKTVYAGIIPHATSLVAGEYVANILAVDGLNQRPYALEITVVDPIDAPNG